MSLPEYVRRETTRHGKTVYYYRPSDASARIRLRSEPGTPEFDEAYRAAKNAPPIVSKARLKLRHRVDQALRNSLLGAQKRAAQKGVPFELSLVWALDAADAQDMRCALTGIQFFSTPRSTSANDPYRPSIDQISPGKGYTKDNCRIVIYAVNVMLFDWGEEVFEAVARAYLEQKRPGL